jgi:hypothetical protein
MSINPQSPDSFINYLFQDLKICKDGEKTIEQRLLIPIEAYIAQTGTQDRDILNLREKLIGVRGMPMSVAQTDAKIFQIFTDALGRSNPGQNSSAAAQAQDSAIDCSTDAQVSDLRADLGKLHQILSSLIHRPDSVIHQSPEDRVKFVFNEDGFEIQIKNDDLREEFQKDLTQWEIADFGGRKRKFPNIFIRDHMRQSQRHSCSFEGGEKIIPTYNMPIFLSMVNVFVANLAGRQDPENLSNLLLLCNTQDVPAYFQLGSLINHLNLFLVQASSNLKPHLLYNIDFAPQGENQFLASVVGNIYFVPQTCVNYSQQEIDNLFEKIGIQKPPRIELNVRFQMGWEAEKVVVKSLDNKGRVVCLDPQTAARDFLGLTADEFEKTKATVQEIRGFLAHSSIAAVKEYLSLIPDALVLNLTKQTQTIEYTKELDMDFESVDLIPDSFFNDHVESQRSTSITYKIGDAEARKIVSVTQAEDIINDARAYAMTFSKDSKVNKKICEKMLCLCTQELTHPVVGYLMTALNASRLTQFPTFHIENYIDYGQVTLEKIRSIFGADKIKINYDFHAILSIAKEAPDPDLEAILKALDLYQIIGMRLSGSFTLALKMNGEFEIKNFKPNAVLDQLFPL